MNKDDLFSCLKSRGTTLAVAAASTNIFDKLKWEKHFRTKIKNTTDYSWDQISSGCQSTVETIAYISDFIYDPIRKIKFADFEESSFWKGIKQAFKTLEHKTNFLKEEILLKGNRINVPFVNAEGIRFVAVFHRNHWGSLGIKIVAVEKSEPNIVVILPHSHPQQ